MRESSQSKNKYNTSPVSPHLYGSAAAPSPPRLSEKNQELGEAFRKNLQKEPRSEVEALVRESNERLSVSERWLVECLIFDI